MKYMQALGPSAPIMFTFIQLVQTVIPIIPGAITIPMGVMAFSPVKGFLLSFFPIMIGSIIIFYIARRYGKIIVKVTIGDKAFDKMSVFFDNRNRGYKVFAIGMLTPISPADLLCYGAGLTNMSFKYFMISLFIGKPITLLIYSLGSTYLIQSLIQLL